MIKPGPIFIHQKETQLYLHLYMLKFLLSANRKLVTSFWERYYSIRLQGYVHYSSVRTTKKIKKKSYPSTTMQAPRGKGSITLTHS
jgi:cytochrome c oxidase subunit IV